MFVGVRGGSLMPLDKRSVCRGRSLRFVGGCGGLAHLMAHLGRTGGRVGLAGSSTAGVVIWCRLFGDAEALADCCCDECAVDSWCRSCWLVAIDRLDWILLMLLTVVALLVVSIIVGCRFL